MFGHWMKSLVFWASLLLLIRVPIDLAESQQPSPEKKPIGAINRPKEHIPSDTEKPPHNEQRVTEQPPPVIQINNPSQAENETANNRQHGDENGMNLSKPFTWTLSQQIAAIASVAGLAQFVVLLLTWRIMRCTARQQLRAYVSATPTRIYGPTQLRQRFSMINHGQTPAYDLVENGVIDIFPYPLPPQFAFPELPPPPFTKMCLYPSQLQCFGMAHAVRDFTSDEIFKAIKGTEYRFYVYGWISYADIFRHKHTTKFCHSFPPSDDLILFMAGKKGENTPMHTEYAAQHNEAD